MAENNEGIENESDLENEEIQHTNGVMNERLQRLEANQHVQALVNDPDVRKVIEAKRAGKPVTVSELNATEVEEVEEPDYEPLTAGIPENDPVFKTLESIDKKLKAREKRAVEAATKPLEARLAQLEDLGNEVRRRDVEGQVAVAKTKFKDLSKYQSKMVELSKQLPSLGVEDLYVLAKSRSGELRQAEQTTFSEKPTSQPRRNASAKSAPPPPARGRKGFSDLLSQSLNGLSLEETK